MGPFNALAALALLPALVAARQPHMMLNGDGPPCHSAVAWRASSRAPAAVSASVLALLVSNTTLPFEPLGHPTDAFEPMLDNATMALHHGVHYKGYVNKFNAAVTEYNTFASDTGASATISLDEDFLRNVNFNGGGALNHAELWRNIVPNGSAINSTLKEAVERDFGDVQTLKAEMIAEAMSVHGSGWAWLVLDLITGRLTVLTTANQDRPPMRYTPILGLDVWEHAYYKKYGPKRKDYLEALWNEIDFTQVGATLEAKMAALTEG